MENDYIEKINQILGTKGIDKRASELIKLYFIGKIKSGKITTNELENQINTLCSRIPKIEFTTSNIVTAYSKEAGILTINKRLLTEGKAEELILPLFMKFESAINQQNRRSFANNIEDFIQAEQVATACSAPISDRLYKLYEMAQYAYGDIEQKADELSNDGVWRGVCSSCNIGFNDIIITGSDNYKKILQLANIYHGEIYTTENMQDPNFVGPFNNPEYQRKSARIISVVESIEGLTQSEQESLQSLIGRIKLFTGCTDKMVEQARNSAAVNKEKDVENQQVGIFETEQGIYNGDNRISEALQLTTQNVKAEINEEIIVSRVQEMLDRKSDWDSRIKHLIIPFFIRSQKIYGWDLDEFQERLNQLDTKINTISFEEFDNMNILGDAAQDKIRLNKKVFFNKKGEHAWPVSPTLFHELGHITDENTREGILTKEKIESTPLIEINFYEWTNTIFERLVSGQKLYKKNNAMELTDSGYSPLAPLGSMLSAALGVPELKFAHIKDKGKEYEKELIDSIFPNGEGKESLSRIRKIFDEYELDTFMSFGKKKANQKLANEMYIECLNLMKKRIEIETGGKESKESEQYKKRQMFLLKKLNHNFKKASKTEGFRFSMSSIVHDIGFCTDKLSKGDTLEIAREYIEEADFGFDNNDLGKYSKAMMPSDSRKQEFNKSLQVPEQDQPKPLEEPDLAQEQSKEDTITQKVQQDQDFDEYE